MLRSIHGRIVLGSIAIAMAVLALLGLVVGEQLRRVAGSSIALQTRQELDPYAADLRNQPDERPDRPAAGTRILVISPQGAAVLDTLGAGMTNMLLHRRVGAARIHSGGVGYLAEGRTVTNVHGIWRIWAVRSSVAADATVQGVTRILLAAALIVLVFVAVGSWLLVRAALRPVRRLRRAADSIQSTGVDERLPTGSGRDEIAALATTLNRFLESQQRGVERERRMVADASHELRTPLAVLTTQLELAHHHFGDLAALETTVRAVERNVAALSRLATQLLELSQLDAGGAARGTEATVDDLVSELMAAIDRARSIAGRDIDVEFDIDPDLDETARASISAIAFGRIVDNLTINAVHATGTGTVDVRLARSRSDLELTVTDTGAGIPEDFIPRAFDRFTRSQRSRADSTHGAGLGLALVKALTTAAGGTVTLGNRRNGGAVARVVLPLGGVRTQA